MQEEGQSAEWEAEKYRKAKTRQLRAKRLGSRVDGLCRDSWPVLMHSLSYISRSRDKSNEL